MTNSFSFKLNELSLTEIIRLQNQISKTLTSRFGKHESLAFSDIVGSTSYFARFGDEAGRRLQQQHSDLINESINKAQGQIVDTAGDSALIAFPTMESAIQSFLQFKQLLQHCNFQLPPEQQWTTRTGIHWGMVLTDGIIHTGDSVNLCAKISSVAQSGKILLSKTAFNELSNFLRLACRPIGTVTLPSTSQSIEILELLWQDLLMIPSTLHIEETRIVLPLPDQPVVNFGRLANSNGSKSNDIVLELPDPLLTNRISRWHFELLKTKDGLVLHNLSDKLTEVDGQSLPQGSCVPIKIGSCVRLAGVITLRFLTYMDFMNKTDKTTIKSKSSITHQI